MTRCTCTVFARNAKLHSQLKLPHTYDAESHQGCASFYKITVLSTTDRRIILGGESPPPNSRAGQPTAKLPFLSGAVLSELLH